MCLHNTIHLDSCIFIFTFQSVKYYFISLFLSNPSTSTHIAYSDTTSLTSLLSPSVAKNISCDDSNPHSLLHKQIPAVTVVTDCLGVHVANTPLHIFSIHIILIIVDAGSAIPKIPVVFAAPCVCCVETFVKHHPIFIAVVASDNTAKLKNQLILEQCNNSFVVAS